jgi:hypothetical protein
MHIDHRSVAAKTLRWAALLLGVMVLSSATTAGPARAASSGCPVKPTGFSPSQSASARQELVPPGADSVTLCRYRGFNDPTPRFANELVGSHTVRDPSQVRAFGEQFDALPPASGTLHASACPADDESSLLAIFDYAHATPDPVSVRLTGCSLATNGFVMASMAFDTGQRLRNELAHLTGCHSSVSNWLCTTDPEPVVAVPVVVGLDVSAAYRVLHRVGLRVSLPAVELDYGLGGLPRVVGQSPGGGRSFVHGANVGLELGCPGCLVESPAVPTHLPRYRVPRFVGLSVIDARRWVAHKALYFVARVGSLRGGDAPSLLDNYRVSRQRPHAGAGLRLGIGTSCCGGTAGSFKPTPLVVWGAQIRLG